MKTIAYWWYVVEICRVPMIGINCYAAGGIAPDFPSPCCIDSTGTEIQLESRGSFAVDPVADSHLAEVPSGCTHLNGPLVHLEGPILVQI